MTTQWGIDLNGHVAVVTGGTRNIGLAIAQALRDHGAKVCIVGEQDQAALSSALDSLGGEGEAVTGLLASVARDDGIDAIYAQTEARLGRVSILINAAASRPHQPLSDISRDDWAGVHRVILGGAFFMSQRLFHSLPDETHGAIVNIGGLSAHRPQPDRAHVIAAKAGLEGLTRALAAEGDGYIRVNCLVPGAINTKRRPGQSNPNDVARMPGKPIDIARAVMLLADPRDLYFTGQTVHVNGGRFMA